MQGFVRKAIMDERNILLRGDTFAYQRSGPMFFSDFVDVADSEHYTLTVQMQGDYLYVNRATLDLMLRFIYPALGSNIGLFDTRFYLIEGRRVSHVLTINTQKGGPYKPGSRGMGASRRLNFDPSG